VKQVIAGGQAMAPFTSDDRDVSHAASSVRGRAPSCEGGDEQAQRGRAPCRRSSTTGAADEGDRRLCPGEGPSPSHTQPGGRHRRLSSCHRRCHAASMGGSAVPTWAPAVACSPPHGMLVRSPTLCLRCTWCMFARGPEAQLEVAGVLPDGRLPNGQWPKNVLRWSSPLRGAVVDRGV
jgi:hypothetical protein